MEATSLYIALVHSPILDKNGKIVSTSVTNLDIHDIARTSCTFGFKKYFIVTPIVEQQVLLKRIFGFWQSNDGEGKIYNKDRFNALSLVNMTNTWEEARDKIEELEGQPPLVVVTGANFKQFSGDTDALIQSNAVDKRPILILFGTGWGLPPTITEKADFLLSPIYGDQTRGYNHLSVRSAVAIYCDRLNRSREKMQL
ncbi:MAG: RNA methyltransferase [Bacteriovoracaceae bacterium]